MQNHKTTKNKFENYGTDNNTKTITHTHTHTHTTINNKKKEN
jgi:hypothetical protein